MKMCYNNIENVLMKLDKVRTKAYKVKWTKRIAWEIIVFIPVILSALVVLAILLVLLIKICK